MTDDEQRKLIVSETVRQAGHFFLDNPKYLRDAYRRFVKAKRNVQRNNGVFDYDSEYEMLDASLDVHCKTTREHMLHTETEFIIMRGKPEMVTSVVNNYTTKHQQEEKDYRNLILLKNQDSYLDEENVFYGLLEKMDPEKDAETLFHMNSELFSSIKSFYLAIVPLQKAALASTLLMSAHPLQLRLFQESEDDISGNPYQPKKPDGDAPSFS